eukprot:GEZU01036737.1.p2 GENE.GEZU01036737.1~~GEZU01036737.1.p2  ORF type:complete len:206 (+),score=29.27 GEZU01036737.1:60-620(+)
MIDGYGRAKLPDRAFEVFYQRMQQQAQKPMQRPTCATISIMLDVCGHNGDLVTAMRVFREDMPRLGIAPELNVYNSVIEAFGRCGDVENAKLFFAELMSLQLLDPPVIDVPDRKTYGTLLYSVFVHNNRVNEAAQFVLDITRAPMQRWRQQQRTGDERAIRALSDLDSFLQQLHRTKRKHDHTATY